MNLKDNWIFRHMPWFGHRTTVTTPCLPASASPPLFSSENQHVTPLDFHHNNVPITLTIELGFGPIISSWILPFVQSPLIIGTWIIKHYDLTSRNRKNTKFHICNSPKKKKSKFNIFTYVCWILIQICYYLLHGKQKN